MTKNSYLITDALLSLRQSDLIMDRISILLPPLKIKFRTPDFEGMVRIIINQQLSGAAATTIFGRLKGSMSEGVLTPCEAVEVDDSIYLKCGVSKAKTRHIKELAKTFSKDPDIINKFKNLDADSLQHEVTKIKGFGPWSASIFSLFYMQHPNVFVYGDASVYRAIRILYGKNTTTEKKLLDNHIKKWAPYNSVACMMMWHWVDNGMPALTLK